MSEQIDWSKAPEGADKYNTHNGMFYTGEQPYLHVFWNGRWKQSSLAKSNERFVYRPSTPSWSGEGLPPVGTVCEVEYDDGRQIWHEAEVIYHKKDGPRIAAARLIGDGRDKLVWVSQFRPIRTPEQIAADERRKAIDEMVKALGMDDPGTAEYIRCGLIYDAGFRKP